MHYLLNKINIKNKMYCCRIFEPDDYGNKEVKNNVTQNEIKRRSI